MQSYPICAENVKVLPALLMSVLQNGIAGVNAEKQILGLTKSITSLFAIYADIP